MTYKILEGNLPRLESKLTRISNKCKKYGCTFSYEKIGGEFQTLKNEQGFEYTAKFILISVQGTAVVNDWAFVASLEHTENGNIIKRVCDVEVPERYYTSKPVCEHCNSSRYRKNTFIIRNVVTGEFKQVGKNCLKDFTSGMNAEMVASYISLFTTIIEHEAPLPGSSYESYLETKEYLQYVAETISKFGYVRRQDGGCFTGDRAYHYYLVDRGWFSGPYRDKLITEMNEVKFDHKSPKIIQTVTDALAWISGQKESSNYIHNLKTACSLEYITAKNFGILASLFSTFNREQAKRRKALESEANSVWVGNLKERIAVKVRSFKCVTSWETDFGTTRIYKIVGIDGNVYTWKTGKILDNSIKELVGTVKDHNEFRGIRQTELTRCRTN
jgi:hypothetical protein